MRYRKRNTGGSLQQAGYFTTDWVQTPTNTSYGRWAAAGTVIGGAESAGSLASHRRKPARRRLQQQRRVHGQGSREQSKSVASSRKRRAGAVIDFFLPPRKLISKFVTIPSHGPSVVGSSTRSVGDGTARGDNGDASGPQPPARTCTSLLADLSIDRGGVLWRQGPDSTLNVDSWH